MFKVFKWLLIVISISLITACGGGGGTTPPADTPTDTPAVSEVTITLIGGKSITLPLGASYVELGATAYSTADSKTVDVTVNSGLVNTNIVGSYSVYYSAVDSKGNTAQTTREVVVADTIKPILTLKGDAYLSWEAGEGFVDPKATVSDNYDPNRDISAYNLSTLNTNAVAKYIIKYRASDSSGNKADEIERTVDVNDTIAPTIALKVGRVGEINYTMHINNDYFEYGATVIDSFEGDISANLEVNISALDVNSSGTYSIFYSAKDSQGNRATIVERRVKVINDQIAPTIALNNGLGGVANYTMEVHFPYHEYGATANDDVDGDITADIDTNSSRIDVNTTGDYNITYSVMDGATNLTEVNRTVYVRDNTKPTITLTPNGSDVNYSMEVHTSYHEYNATANDNYDGDISNNINIDSSAVDVNATGDYTVVYSVCDDNSNCTESNRTLTVKDGTPPTITLTPKGSDINYSMEVNTPYHEYNATANDNYNGNISNNIIIDATNVDVNLTGTYQVNYKVCDSSNNCVESNRTVTVEDTIKPVIVLNDANGTLGEKHQYMEVYSIYVEKNATVTDNYDDNKSISGDASELNSSKLGDYNITYSGSDRAGNIADDVNRTVTVVDTQAPTITVNGDNPVTLEVHSNYIDNNATVRDNYDSNRILEGDTSEVNISKVGTYQVVYNTSDTSGNEANETNRTVKIEDNTPPVITINPKTPSGTDINYSMEVHTSYHEYNATVNDNYDGDISNNINIDSSAVDVNATGDYTVVYSVCDDNSNCTESNRTVTVKDGTPPVIILNDANASTPGVKHQYIEVFDNYIEKQAIVVDNYDDNDTIDGNSSDVNTSNLGDYNVTYNTTDNHGNDAVEVNRTVTVVDREAPEITLNGDATIEVEGATEFVDPNATVDDNYYTMTTPIEANTSELNMSKVGDYNITYSATDGSGNHSELNRTVQVRDNTPPTIDINGSNTLTIQVHGNYIEYNATASDTVDGNLSDDINISQNDLNTSKVGDYNITYSVQDISGNYAEANRTVHVVDTEKPEIILNDANATPGEKHQYMEVHDSYVEKGAIVTDNYDANDTIDGNTTELNISKLGDYSITYNATDENGNIADEVNRTVTVQDTTVPVIHLNKSIGDETNVTVEAGSDFKDDYNATVTDNYDNNWTIEGNISDVNTSELGTHYVVYDTNDSSGNIADEVNRTVRVVDTTAPIITLIQNGGNENYSLEANVSDTDMSTYFEYNATAEDNLDGNLTASIEIDMSDLNLSKLGDYNITYTVTDSQGHTTEVNRTITVEDHTVPEITLLGDDPYNTPAGHPYEEPNATAFDNLDGNISALIVIDSSEVNISKLGDYNVTYNVTDSEGNIAVEVNRTVRVVDTEGPIITLIGDTVQDVKKGTPYVEYNATAEDAYDGNVTDDIVIDDSLVDTDTEGDYNVTYNVDDSLGNPADEVIRVVHVRDFNIKKTGQTASYDSDGNQVTDNSVKDDGEYEAGVDTNYTRDPDTNITTDNITKLMWQDTNETNTTTYQWLDGDDNGDEYECIVVGNDTYCNNDINGSTDYDGNSTKNESDMIAGYYCATLTLGGHDDWRVPTANELLYIIDWGRNTPSMDDNKFLYVATANEYWSSDTDGGKIKNALSIDMKDGKLSSDGKDAFKHVRCVREIQ